MESTANIPKDESSKEGENRMSLSEQVSDASKSNEPSTNENLNFVDSSRNEETSSARSEGEARPSSENLAEINVAIDGDNKILVASPGIANSENSPAENKNYNGTNITSSKPKMTSSASSTSSSSNALPDPSRTNGPAAEAKKIKGTVCVTGATGFLASHIIQQLLLAGYRVHATIRSMKDPLALRSVKQLAYVPKSSRMDAKKKSRKRFNPKKTWKFATMKEVPAAGSGDEKSGENGAERGKKDDRTQEEQEEKDDGEEQEQEQEEAEAEAEEGEFFHNFSSRLLVFEGADLCVKKSFEAAIRDCDYVIHCAAPALSAPLDSGSSSSSSSAMKEQIDAVYKGTHGLMQAIQAHGPKVKRLVITGAASVIAGASSSASTMLCSEKDWNHSIAPSDVFTLTKRATEEAAWNFMRTNGRQFLENDALEEVLRKDPSAGQSFPPLRFDLVVIHPGAMLGPPVLAGGGTAGGTGSKLNPSLRLFVDMAHGKHYRGIPHVELAVVDVRDCARAHVAAIAAASSGLTAPSGRYILVNESLSLMQLVDKLRFVFPEFPLPKVGGKSFIIVPPPPLHWLIRSDFP